MNFGEKCCDKNCVNIWIMCIDRRRRQRRRHCATNDTVYWISQLSNWTRYNFPSKSIIVAYSMRTDPMRIQHHTHANTLPMSMHITFMDNDVNSKRMKKKKHTHKQQIKCKLLQVIRYGSVHRAEMTIHFLCDTNKIHTFLHNFYRLNCSLLPIWIPLNTYTFLLQTFLTTLIASESNQIQCSLFHFPI